MATNNQILNAIDLGFIDDELGHAILCDEIQSCSGNSLRPLFNAQFPNYEFDGFKCLANGKMFLLYEPRKKFISGVYPGIHIDVQNNFFPVIPRGSNPDPSGKVELIENYKKLLDFEGIPEHIRLTAFGYVAIAGFFNVLSKSNLINDVYPSYFVVGVHGCGMTSFLKLLTDGLFGSEMVLGKNMETTARLRQLFSESTFPLFVDEINDMIDTSLDFGKELQMSMKRSVIGTTLSRIWINPIHSISPNKINIIQFIHKSAQSNLSDQFEQIQKGIYSNPKIGFDFIHFILSYLKYAREGEPKTKNDLETLVYMIKEGRNRIIDVAKSIPIQLDEQRITSYSLIWLGLEFWQYYFRTNLESDVPFLSNFLKDYVAQAKLIQELESQHL